MLAVECGDGTVEVMKEDRRLPHTRRRSEGDAGTGTSGRTQRLVLVPRTPASSLARCTFGLPAALVLSLDRLGEKARVPRTAVASALWGIAVVGEVTSPVKVEVVPTVGGAVLHGTF